MKNVNETEKAQIWTMIEKEKKRDRKIKLISTIAWSITIILLLVYMVFTAIDLAHALKGYHKGLVPFKFVIESITPFLMISGGLGLIIAVLSTIGMFLRMRTTTLLEIQQRLANLEGMITSEV